MHLEDCFATADVRQVHGDLAIEPARPQQRGIEHIGPVGGGDNDNAFLCIEAVHLDEERIECLLALIIAAAKSMPAAPAHGINFVNEHQAGRVLAGLLEHIAHAAGADTDKHLNKVRPANAEERRVGFARDGFSQKCFAGARRADHQNAFWNATAQPLKLLGIFQELNQLGNFFNGFVDAGDIFKRSLVPFFGQEPGLALAETKRPLTRHLDLANEEEPNERRNDDDRQHAPDDAQEHRVGFARLKLRLAEKLFFNGRAQPRFSTEKHLLRPSVFVLERIAVLIRNIVLADDLGQQRVLWAVIDGRLRNEIGIHQLLKAPLRKIFTLRIPALAHEHQQDDASKNGDPNNPGPGRNPEFATLLGALLVVSRFVVVWHLLFQLDKVTMVAPGPQRAI